MPDIAFIRGVTRGHILHTRWICIRVWKSRLQRKVLWFPLKAGKRFGISGSKSKEQKENRRKNRSTFFIFANFTSTSPKTSPPPSPLPHPAPAAPNVPLHQSTSYPDNNPVAHASHPHTLPTHPVVANSPNPASH